MRLVRGTVTQASPLRVRLDGASSDSAAESVAAAPALNARVHVLVDSAVVLVLTVPSA